MNIYKQQKKRNAGDHEIVTIDQLEKLNAHIFELDSIKRLLKAHSPHYVQGRRTEEFIGKVSYRHTGRCDQAPLLK